MPVIQDSVNPLLPGDVGAVGQEPWTNRDNNPPMLPGANASASVLPSAN